MMAKYFVFCIIPTSRQVREAEWRYRGFVGKMLYCDILVSELEL